jgi:GT2 family glycosyltransferase
MDILGQLLKSASLIVCTVDRTADLEECLKSLRPFRAEVNDIIVVNNGPHLEAVEEVARRHDARVVTEPRRGVSRARNAGIRAAAGNILAFLDDDSVADPNWLPLLLAPFEDPQVLGVVGSVWAQSLADPVSQAFDRMHRAPLPESKLTLPAASEKNSFPLRQALVGNANLAIRREAFERFGYFDTRFGRGTRIGSGEEPDLLLALLLGGGKIVIEPAAGIFHRHSTDPRAFRRWAFQSGCAHTAMMVKYFLRESSRRGAILRYAASRIFWRPKDHTPFSASVRIPRLPFLLGSLYGPIALLLSGRNNPTFRTGRE